MSSFSESEEKALDWKILRDGGVALYRNRGFLKEDVETLRDLGYGVYEFDCTTWTSELKVHEELARELAFPDYYGKNMDALWDCLSDFAVPLEGGTAIVLHRYDAFAGDSLNTRLVQTIVDILARTSRHFLLTGRRFAALIQSDDPRMHFDGLSPVSAVWNRREWLLRNRGLG